jgi:hypothetical protein
MNQKPRQAFQPRESGHLGGPGLAHVLALVFALTLVAIGVLMLCGALLWQTPLITAIGGSLLPVFGEYFKLTFSHALRPLTADEAKQAGGREGEPGR